MIETPIYQESQTLPTWFLVLVGAVLMVAIVSSILTAPEEVLGLVLVVLVLLVIFFSLSYRMRVVITSSELRFGFGFWRKRMPLRDVQVVGIESIPLMNGMGIHYWRGKWIYSARFNGRGMHLVYQGKKHYLIGSNQPETLQSALMSVLGH
jgi:hypothetical protein